MKKFKVFFSSMFVIGLIGVLSLVFFTDKPTENYFAACFISAIAMLPRILFVFFMSPRDLVKTTFSGALKFYFFYIVFIVLENWIFPYTLKNSFVGPLIAPVITVIVFIWGWVYSRKNKLFKSELLNRTVDNIKKKNEIKDVEDPLTFQEMFVLPSSDKIFVVEVNFRLGKVKYEGVPYISYIGPNFIKHFLHRVEPVRSKRSINRYRALRALDFLSFSSLISKSNHHVFLSDIWDTLVQWEKGYKVLLSNGSFNIFPVKGCDDEVWYIIVTGDNIKGSWEIEAYPQIGTVHKKENVYSLN